jgi:preprotein translocase subunit SecG
MFLFLTVLQGIVAAALVGIILMQKSEGGGLGMGGGGSPASLFSARGAGDFLTRTTSILAILFVALSIILAALAVDVSTGGDLDTSLERQVTPAAPAADAAPDQPVPAQPSNDPLSGLAN